MTRSKMTTFLKSCLFWLLPGIAAGIAAAFFITVQEYDTLTQMAGSILKRNSISEGLKKTGANDQKAGEIYLSQYGYNRYDRLRDNLFPAVGLSLLLFEGIGLLLFASGRRKEKRQDERITEITDYLRAANAGEAYALSRIEDRFSHLEDEIYKTVQMLTITRESAVRDHEVLSRRIADIAHQLKTPLTSMSLMTELLEEYETEDTAEYLMRLKTQAKRLQTLVTGLLVLARLDSHAIIFDKSEFDVAQWITETIESIQPLLNQKHITLSVQGPDAPAGPVLLTADRHWTGEAFLNILKNCAEHTPRHGTVYVSYGQNPLYTEVVISDSGPGFSKADLPHLFERFYKGQGASKDSAGIGLALSKLIMEHQNGQIHAENTSDGHARFQLRLFS